MIKKDYLVMALSGFLATVLGLSLYLGEIEGVSKIQKFGLFAITLAVPFVLSLIAVAKFLEPEFKMVQTPLQGVRIGICGGAMLAALMGLFAGLGQLIYSLFASDGSVTSVGGDVFMILYFVIGALVWAAVPIIVFGTALGLCLYSRNKRVAN